MYTDSPRARVEHRNHCAKDEIVEILKSLVGQSDAPFYMTDTAWLHGFQALLKQRIPARRYIIVERDTKTHETQLRMAQLLKLPHVECVHGELSDVLPPGKFNFWADLECGEMSEDLVDRLLTQNPRGRGVVQIAMRSGARNSTVARRADAIDKASNGRVGACQSYGRMMVLSITEHPVAEAEKVYTVNRVEFCARGMQVFWRGYPTPTAHRYNDIPRFPEILDSRTARVWLAGNDAPVEVPFRGLGCLTRHLTAGRPRVRPHRRRLRPRRP